MKRLILLSVAVCATAFAIWQNNTVADTHGKLSHSLVQQLNDMGEGNGPGEPASIDILVKISSTADLTGAEQIEDPIARRQFVYNRLTTTARATQRNFLRSLNRRTMTYEQFYIVNMVLVRNVTAEDIQAFAARADVAKIYGTKALPMRPPTFEAPMDLMALDTVETNIQAVGADRVWSELNVTGEGIVVAGQDTGVQWDHPALVKQYRGYSQKVVDHNYNWYDAIQAPITGGSSCGYATTAPCDDNAHGTHTLGTVLGHDGGVNQIGMAPGSEWIACRNMDAGTGRPQTYMRCFEFFFAPYALDKNGMTDGRPELAAHVINNSWGCPSSELCEGDVLMDILRSMKAAGIFVVVSAGNDGPSCSTIQDTPAWHSAETFSVGAYNHRDNKIAGFSSRGPSKYDAAVGPDIAAPGVGIRSSTPGSKYQGGFWSGTSMAGPHVAGLVALMWSANNKLIGKIDETIKIIEDTADRELASACMPAGQENAIPNNTFGFGRMNAYAAVKEALKYQ